MVIEVVWNNSNGINVQKITFLVNTLQMELQFKKWVEKSSGGNVE